MKLALSISKHNHSAPLLENFAKCNYYLILDTFKNQQIIIPNPYFNELGGAGIQSARFLIEQNVDVLITRKIGLNPLRFLTSVNIKVFQSREIKIEEIIQLYSDGKLFELKINKNNLVIEKHKKRL